MHDRGETMIHIIQGQFEVSDRPGDVMTTVLGSCVAACLHDPVARLGGMNHFLLPGSDPDDRTNVKYGAYSMEQLINAMLRAGAQRGRIEAHLFGGANVVKGLGRIGDSNRLFATDFVRSEGFVLRTDDTGGVFGRRVRFDPVTGRSEVRILNAEMPAVQKVERVAPRQPAPSGAVELF